MIVDLFAGPGGWDVGLAKVRPDLSMVGVEYDRGVVETRTRAGLTTIWADVSALDPTGLTDVDGLVASPPCQDWSTSGKLRRTASLRGQLVEQVPRWVEALSPRWVACEQVAGVLPVWEIYARRLAALGYWTWSGILFGADYGLPQLRTRAILLAHRDRPVAPPRPTHDRYGRHGLPHWRPLLEVIDPVDGHDLADLFVDPVTSSGVGRRARYGRSPIYPLIRPAMTMGSDGFRWAICTRDGTHLRKITRAEGCRIQGFPDDYPFPEKRSPMFAQCGDAVPSHLAAAIFTSILGQ